MPRHAENRKLPYTAQQIFDLVADVGSYPEFLPWTSMARIRSRKPLEGRSEGAELMEADLVISFKVFRERFGSRVVLLPEEGRIETEFMDGPFKYLHSVWEVRDRPRGGCTVSFEVDFELRNAMLRRVIGVVFDQAMRRVVRAFERRADELYGGG